MSQKTVYQCNFCPFTSEFLNQEIWEVILPMGYVMHDDETPKSLTIYKAHVCLSCGVKIYRLLMEQIKQLSDAATKQ